MADTRRISTLIENQLPEFISSDYENFTKVVEKYYEQLESPGQPLDIIQNITKYSDIDFYEKNLLNQTSTLVSSINASENTVQLADGSSFPKENGYIRIDEEILFYETRVDNVLNKVSRGVSGNTKLGDLYEKSNFVTTNAAEHVSGSNVQNISNLFLYAIVKNFESDYLASFPEKYLKNDVDKRTLIKNITDFYQSKGTDRSIKFVFNTLISKTEEDKPEVISPKDFTLKASTSDWVTSYSLKVQVLQGDPTTLIGEQIIQQLDPFNSNIGYASAVVDNVFSAGNNLYQISLDTSTVNNVFNVASKTELTEDIASWVGIGDRINVDSTIGWGVQGRFLIDAEEFRYVNKNIKQFVVESRTNNLTYVKGTPVYSYTTVTSGDVTLLVTGVLYNLSPKSSVPFCEEGDSVEIFDKGFETTDPKIAILGTTNPRWQFSSISATSNSASIDSQISSQKAGVQAIYEDENYYYICSSGFPLSQILKTDTVATLKEQKNLKLIRKNPQNTTEIYKTTQRDVGMFIDGTLAFSHKDFDQIKFGLINKFTITSRGDGYLDAPKVLIDNVDGKARSSINGEIVSSIQSIDSAMYNEAPEITITSGRNGRASAIVTAGRITSLVIEDAGEYYTTPPIVRIIDRLGKGRFADYNTIIKDGKIVDFEMVDEGKFYTRSNVIVDILSVGSGATATCGIVTWTKDRVNKLKDVLDSNNGYYFVNYNADKGNGYGVCARPLDLSISLVDNGSQHSPILGFAYDGLPIYGPYGFTNPLDKNSAVARLSSAYVLKSNRLGGPSKVDYPIGTFIEDYVWMPSTETGKLELDENNGRFCVTPEYPEGTYAYFTSIDNEGNPTFPYLVGEKYYSLPVDSNYNSDLSQENLPTNVKRLKTADGLVNGSNTILKINSVSNGNVDGVDVVTSPDSFKVGNKFITNDKGSNGFGASAFVREVTGKTVNSLTCKSLDPTNATSVSYLRLVSAAYLFKNDVITQEDSNFTGTVIGDVINSNNFVLENVTGTYVPGNKLNSSSSILSILLDKNSFYTANSILSLTDGDESTLASGRIIEFVSNQNTVKVELLSGNFIVPEDAVVEYFLQSNTLGDTVGSKVITQSNLSRNLEAFSADDNIALIETDEPHNVGVGSQVDITLNPDVAQTTTDYYVRKRFYQEIKLQKPNFSSTLKDSGVGRGILLNGGLGYTAGEFLDVELIFLDQSQVRSDIGAPGDSKNARATLFVSDFGGTGYGSVSIVTITTKGSDYIKGDILTVIDSDLNRNPGELSTQRLAVDVDHVGLSLQNDTIKLNQVNKLSIGDLLLLDSEIIKVTTINESERTIVVDRGQESSKLVDHYNNARISLYSGKYRFDENSRPLGDGTNKPYVISYDPITQNMVLAFNYDVTSPSVVTFSSIFQDDSTPAKSIDISEVNPSENRLEFSKDINFATYAANTDIRIQKYYRYKFDTSHSSMRGIFLDFSASRQGNLFTEEKEISGIQPGNVGSYVAITLGFGPAIVGSVQKRYPVNFDTYYYFIKAGSNVNTDNAALKVIDDPIAGLKSAIFVTPNKFAYSIKQTPDYDGKGSISYNTTSAFAEGKIVSASIDNLGQEYSRMPIIEGCLVSPDNETVIKSTIDTITTGIATTSITWGGKKYVNPKAIVTNGDGTGAEFKVYSALGTVTRIDILNPGKGFTYAPTISVFETDVKAYFTSSNIGVPKDIKIISNGGGFHADQTIETVFRSSYALIAKGDIPQFFDGERVQQRIGNTTIFSAYISKGGWRKGSNIIRLSKIDGVFDTNVALTSVLDSSRTVEVSQVLYTEFDADVRTYYDNLGRYASDRGKISSRSQRLTDSYFYQDYSYMIQSRTPIDVWRDLIKQTTHPAGFQLFGEVLIDSTQQIEMPVGQTPTTSITIIELPKVNINSEYKSTILTNTLVTIHDLNVRRGVGSISIDEYDIEGILSKELILQQDFDGRYASDADFIGTPRELSSTSTLSSNAGTLNAPAGEVLKLYAVKQLSNNISVQPTDLFSQTYISVLSVGDIEFTKGGGIVDLGSTPVQGFVWDYSSTQKVFGARISDTAENPLQNCEVGDVFTYYQTATTYFTFEVTELLAPAYDVVTGINGNGNVIGRRTFTLIDKANNLAYSPYNEQELFLTLNGVAQEPLRSFKVVGNQITFADAPLGVQYPVTGQDSSDIYVTDPTKFVCRAFKFKNDLYNDRYLRKLKDISPQFDGITTQFDLYWNDDTIVKAADGEKFLIFMNGVLQRAKGNENAPLGNAYYIKKRTSDSQPDAIVFSEAPRNFADDIDNPPTQLDQRESFFGYTVGAYDRLTIDNRLIPYRGVGPYLVFDEIEKTVKNITDSRFAYVFVDGVLQNPDTYILNGPNITFTDILTKYTPETGEATFSKVDIISLYGRQVPKTLSFYDFDRFGYTNELTVNLERKITTANGTSEYLNFQNNFTAFNPYLAKKLYTLDANGIKKHLGKIDAIRFNELADGTANGSSKPDVPATKFNITLLNASNIDFENLSYNPLTDDDDDYTRVQTIFVTDGTNVISLNNLNKEYSIDISYRTDNEGLRELTRNIPGWLRGSVIGDEAYNVKYELLNDILEGDQILVDGESETRTIESIPGFATTRNFRNGEVAKYEHFAKVEATNYNGLIRGEGLSVTCEVTDGVVSGIGFSDLEWNKRDLKLFFDTGILLQPTAYQYFSPPQIKFVAQDGNGGGAKAEVLSVNGQILDVILTAGGAGYTSPPKAIVTRGYDVYRKPNRVISTLYNFTVSTQVASGGSLSIVQTEVLLFSEGAKSGIFSIISLGGLTGVATSAASQKTTEIHGVGVEAGSELRPNIGQITTKRPVDNSVSQATVPGTTVTQITLDISPVSITSTSTIETQELNLIIEIDINRPAVFIQDSDAYSGLGAFLDSALSQSATTVYIPNTSLFSDQGKLQIGKEIVSYDSKLLDRFLDVTRGIDGSLAQAHPGGQYIRTLPESISAFSAGVQTILQSEISVATTDISLVEQTATITSENSVVSQERIIEVTIRHEEINAFIDVEVEKEVLIIPPESQIDNTSLGQGFSNISYISTAVENISSNVTAVQHTSTIIKVENNIELVQNLQVGTQITKFDGFATITAISSALLTPETQVEVSVAPVISTMNALVTNSVITVILATDSAARVDFTRAADGGILGGETETERKDDGATQAHSVQVVSTVFTVILSNVDTSASGIESTYSVSSHLPNIGGIDKPADIQLTRQTGVIDYFTELVVLETSIVTRN